MKIIDVPSIAIEKIQHTLENGLIDLKKKKSSLFGLPIRQNLVQLYRYDNEYTTFISIQNFLSYLVSDPIACIEYIITIYNARGKMINEVHKLLNPFEVLHCDLNDLSNNSLDEYGVFTVHCNYESNAIQSLLGFSSPQFMTIYVPKDINNAPQLIHSHKYINLFTPPKRKITRISSLVENGHDMHSICVFVINSSTASLSGNVTLRDCCEYFHIPRMAVAKLDFNSLPRDGFNIASEFNRNINHKKPIIFRRFNSGRVTASHS